MQNSFSAISNWQEAVLVAGTNILTRFFGFIPSFLGAIFIFVLGLILAKWSKSLIVKILGAIKLDKVLRKSGLNSFFDKADIRVKVEVFLGEIVRWLVVIVFSMAAVNILGLTTVSSVLSSILAYLPNIVSAVLVLTIGILLAGLVENLIKGAINQVEPKTSRLLSKVGSYLVVIVSILAAINELGIAQSLINTLFVGVIATLTLGIGLSIGLGAKDLVSKLLLDWYTNSKKKDR